MPRKYAARAFASWEDEGRVSPARTDTALSVAPTLRGPAPSTPCHRCSNQQYKWRHGWKCTRCYPLLPWDDPRDCVGTYQPPRRMPVWRTCRDCRHSFTLSDVVDGTVCPACFGLDIIAEPAVRKPNKTYKFPPARGKGA